MNENPAREIISTLKRSDNEGTESPYWLIIDPSSLRPAGDYATAEDIANCITGPFFSRSDADGHLAGRRYAFSKSAIVYCHSGYASWKYKDLCRTIDCGGEFIKLQESQRGPRHVKVNQDIVYE